MTKGSYLIIRRGALKLDGWTYGDWRQYVVFLDDGDACCVRMSGLPSFLFVVGLIALVLVALPVVMVASAMPVVPIVWDRVAFIALVGFLLLGLQVVQWLTPWRLVVVVGTSTRNADGSWDRVL